jgi:hypothetical protein
MLLTEKGNITKATKTFGNEQQGTSVKELHESQSLQKLT